MKKLILAGLVALVSITSHAVVIQGEYTPGVNPAIITDINGVLQIAPLGGSLPVSLSGTLPVSISAPVSVTGTVGISGTPTVGITGTVPISGAMVIYDSTTGSGTKIGTMSTLVQNNMQAGIAFTNGLTVVTTGLTPADITIMWK